MLPILGMRTVTGFMRNSQWTMKRSSRVLAKHPRMDTATMEKFWEFTQACVSVSNSVSVWRGSGFIRILIFS